MTIELCDICCKQINKTNRFEIYTLTEITENSKVYDNTKMFVCSECGRKFVEMLTTFKKGYTKERIENIQKLDLF